MHARLRVDLGLPDGPWLSRYIWAFSHARRFRRKNLRNLVPQVANSDCLSHDCNNGKV